MKKLLSIILLLVLILPAAAMAESDLYSVFVQANEQPSYIINVLKTPEKIYVVAVEVDLENGGYSYTEENNKLSVEMDDGIHNAIIDKDAMLYQLNGGNIIVYKTSAGNEPQPEETQKNDIQDDWDLIFDCDYVQIYQIGDVKIGSEKIIHIPVAIINKTDHYISIYISNVLCNGWEIDAYSPNVSPGAKKKGEILFWADKAFVEELDDVLSLQFCWRIEDGTENKTLFKQGEREEHRFW